MPTFQHDHYQRNFTAQPVETQLVFDFMHDVSARDPHAPDEIALKIVRSIFRDASAEGWSISTDAIAATKAVNHREHVPPPGMPERRLSARQQEDKAQPPLRQSMRPPTARVDLSETRTTVSTPGYMMVAPPDYAAPMRRLGIVLALIVAYIEVLSYPVEVRASWETIGQFFTNVQGIAAVLQRDGVKGTASYRPKGDISAH